MARRGRGLERGMAGRITAAMERGRTRKIARRVLVSSAIFRYHPFFRHVLFFGLLPSVRSFVRSFARSLARSFVRSVVRSLDELFLVVFSTRSRIENAFQFGHGSRGTSRRGVARRPVIDCLYRGSILIHADSGRRLVFIESRASR